MNRNSGGGKKQKVLPGRSFQIQGEWRKKAGTEKNKEQVL